jgi:hypothetical protein
MSGNFILDQLTSNTGKSALLSLFSIALGWIGSTVAGWWKSRDRYQAHVTWQTTDTMYGEQDLPVIVIQSIHTLPINVTRIRIRNGFGRKVDQWPFYGEGPEDYPELPRQIEPMKSTRFWLDHDVLREAVKESRFLEWLWVPRVYVGIETMGRGERKFVAEGGLKMTQRRRRYQR